MTNKQLQEILKTMPDHFEVRLGNFCNEIAFIDDREIGYNGENREFIIISDEDFDDN